ncbi:MAG: aminodeoxychorismate lyase, partial [Bacillota bacterium]|nr:aminodeoxychorismate lyase [Bacillota bacterium]
PSGSTGADIAQLLIDAGLITEANEFYNAVIAAEADTRLQAGDFTIPAGATPEQVVNILTQ